MAEEQEQSSFGAESEAGQEAAENEGAPFPVDGDSQKRLTDMFSQQEPPLFVAAEDIVSKSNEVMPFDGILEDDLMFPPFGVVKKRRGLAVLKVCLWILSRGK